MKYILSILLSSLILLSGLQISLATHMCCGSFAAAKISFSGKPANCGMEKDKPLYPFTKNILTGNCCQNKIFSYKVSPNYNFASHKINYTNHVVKHIYSITVISVSNNAILQGYFHHVKPPGLITFNNTDQSRICVFRI